MLVLAPSSSKMLMLVPMLSINKITFLATYVTHFLELPFSIIFLIIGRSDIRDSHCQMVPFTARNATARVRIYQPGSVFPLSIELPKLNSN